MKKPRRRKVARAPKVTRYGSVSAAVEDGWLAARRSAIQLAHERLGGSEKRCRWLLEDFTMRDPATISPAERAMWRENLLALALGPRSGGGARWITVYENEPLDDELRSLWQRVVALTSSHRESVALPPLKGWLGRQQSNPDDPYIRMGRGYEAEDFEAALLHAVADLLIGCEHLRECPECHRLFVATRRQLRHPKCSQAARTQTYRAKKRRERNG